MLDDMYPVPPVFPMIYSEAATDYIAFPAFYLASKNTSDDMLSHLDSDTRSYVLKHTSSERTRSDIEDCVYNLKNRTVD